MKNVNKEQLKQLTHRSQKERIRKIKTQHDDEANINYDLLFQERKKLHQNSIKYATYADKKADAIFPLKPIQIGFVQSLTLKDDLKFKQIQHLLRKYNQEIVQYDEKSALGLHLKTVVMDSMLKFMRLMMQAPDATAKKRILDISYYWFKKNLDSAKSKKRNKNSLQKQIRNILIESKLVPKSIINKELPSEKQKQQLYNYNIKARTMYPQIDAPSSQLENYITHKLGFVHQSQKQQNQANRLNITQDQIREEKWKKRIVFKRPYIQHPNYDEIQEEQQQNLLIGQNILKKDNQNFIEQTQQVQNQNLQKPVGSNEALIPENAQQNAQQLDIGVPDADQNEVDDQPQEPQEQQKQKRGKLDPLVKIFLMDRQKRIKTEGQVSADLRFNNKQNWKMQQKKFDQKNAQFISQWAGNRSRFKSQLSRKIQSIRAFTSVTKSKLSTSQNPIRVQNTINKVKLRETLKQYGDYLHKQPVHQVLNTQTSMSLYDRKRAKTQANSTLKPFSAALEDRKRIEQKSQYLEQIHRLKQKFAKYKLYTPLDNFKKAIIHPEQKQCVWSELDNLTSEGIQLPRSQMISNPFAKFAKKKKKKGKKKK